MLREDFDSLVSGRDWSRRDGVLGTIGTIGTIGTGFAAAVLPELSQARRLALQAGGRRSEAGP